MEKGLIRLGLGRRPRRALAALAADRRAINALEFALVGTLFMLFVGMICDTGILLFQQSMLDNATGRAARFIRTGQVQLAGGGASTSFTNSLCNDLSALVGCGNIQYKVTSAAAFSSLSTAVVSDGHGNLTGQGTFTPGGAGQDVVVQVAWNRPYFIPWVGNFVNPGGTMLMVSTYVFRNEFFN